MLLKLVVGSIGNSDGVVWEAGWCRCIVSSAGDIKDRARPGAFERDPSGVEGDEAGGRTAEVGAARAVVG